MKDIQAALLVAYLDAVLGKGNQRPLASDIDAQSIANLLWAMAKLGELIKTEEALSTSVSLVHELGEYGQFTQEELLIILWSLLACSARLYLDGNADGNDILQQSINKLFTHVKNELIDSEQDKSTLTMAAYWLDTPCLVASHYQTLPNNNIQISSLFI